MDDVLYTISDLKVLASSLDDYSEINDVDFPKKRNYPVYYADGGFGGEVSIRPSSDPASSFAVVDEPEVLE